MTVLLYHDVVARSDADSVGFPGPLAARYKLEPDRFEAHLDAIASTGLEVGFLPWLSDRDSLLPRSRTVLTFDDGGASALLIGRALEQRGWRGYFFIPTSAVGRRGFLDVEGIKALAARGHVVGTHSHTHPTYMGRLPLSELVGEWQRSRDVLGEILGEEPDVASVPGGFLSARVIESAARAGLRVLMTSEPSRRVRWFGDLTILGRFGIWSSTSPSRAAAYAACSRRARAQLWIEWRAKHATKRVSPAAYQRLRALRASHRRVR